MDERSREGKPSLQASILFLRQMANNRGTMKSDACSGMNVEINNLKSSVSNGKAAVASAITDKGVSTSATASFSTMAANIRSIIGGISKELTYTFSSSSSIPVPDNLSSIYLHRILYSNVSVEYYNGSSWESGFGSKTVDQSVPSTDSDIFIKFFSMMYDNVGIKGTIGPHSVPSVVKNYTTSPSREYNARASGTVTYYYY